MMTTPSLQSDYADFEWLIRYGKDSSSFGQTNSGGSSESSSSGSSFGQSDGSSSPTPKPSEPSEPKNETGEGVFDRMEEEHNEETSQAETTATSGGQGDAPFMMIGNYKYELVQSGKNAGKYIFAFTLPNGQKVCREYSEDRETANILASKGEEFDPYKETTGQRRITDDDYNSMRSEWAQRAQAQSTGPKLPKGYENMPPLAQEWYRTGKILNGQYSIANGGPARDVASIAAKMAKLPRDSYEWRQANNELVARMANGVNDPDGSVDLQPFRDALIPYKTADALGLARRYRFRPEGATKDDAYYDLVKNSVALQEALVEYGNNFDKTFVHTYTSQIPKETYLVDDLREKVMEAGRQALSGNTSLTGPVTDTINDAIVGTQEEPSETETGIEEEQSEQSSEETVAPVGARDIDAIKAVLQQSTIEPDRMASLFKGNQLSQKTVSRQIKERGLTPEKSTYTAQDLLKTIWVRGNLSESTSNKMLALAQAKRTGDIASAREVLHDIWETRSNTFARAFVHHGDSDLLSTTFGIDIQKYGIRGFSQADRAYMTELASMSSGDLERLAATEMSKASEIRRLFDNGVLANPWEMTEETEAEPDETDAGAFEALRRDGEAINWIDTLNVAQPGVLKASQIHVHPEDYQYKSGTNKEGAVESWLQGRTFHPGLAETIDVWKDPDTGEYVCINGHHRLALAKQSNYGGDLPVWIHDVRTKDEARVLGALLNIQQRKGTAVDAATVLREMDLPKEVRDALGFDEENSIGTQAMGIAQLGDTLYSQVQKGRIPAKIGFIIGACLGRKDVDNADDKQVACWKFMQKHGYDEGTPYDRLKGVALSFRNAQFAEDGSQLSFFPMLSTDAYNEAFSDLQYAVISQLRNSKTLGSLIKQKGAGAQDEGLVTGVDYNKSEDLRKAATDALRFFDEKLTYRKDFHDQYFSEQVKKFLDAQTRAGESGSEKAKSERDAIVKETVGDLLRWGGDNKSFDEWVAARSAERMGPEATESASEPERGESGQTADEGGEETVSNGGVQSPEGDGLLAEGDREDDGNQLPEGGESGNQVQSVEEDSQEADEAALQSLGTEETQQTDQPSPQEAGEQIANTLSDVMNEAGLDTSDVESEPKTTEETQPSPNGADAGIETGESATEDDLFLPDEYEDPTQEEKESFAGPDVLQAFKNAHEQYENSINEKYRLASEEASKLLGASYATKQEGLEAAERIGKCAVGIITSDTRALSDEKKEEILGLAKEINKKYGVEGLKSFYKGINLEPTGDTSAELLRELGSMLMNTALDKYKRSAIRTQMSNYDDFHTFDALLDNYYKRKTRGEWFTRGMEEVREALEAAGIYDPDFGSVPTDEAYANDLAQTNDEPATTEEWQSDEPQPGDTGINDIFSDDDEEDEEEDAEMLENLLPPEEVDRYIEDEPGSDESLADSLAQEHDIETQPGTLTEEQPTMETEPDTVEQADTMPAQDEQRAQEIAQTPETGHGTEPPVTENLVEPTATEAPQIEQQPAAPSDEHAAMEVGKPAENVQPAPKPKKEPKKTEPKLSRYQSMGGLETEVPRCLNEFLKSYGEAFGDNTTNSKSTKQHLRDFLEGKFGSLKLGSSKFMANALRDTGIIDESGALTTLGRVIAKNTKVSVSDNADSVCLMRMNFANTPLGRYYFNLWNASHFSLNKDYVVGTLMDKYGLDQKMASNVWASLANIGKSDYGKLLGIGLEDGRLVDTFDDYPSAETVLYGLYRFGEAIDWPEWEVGDMYGTDEAPYPGDVFGIRPEDLRRYIRGISVKYPDFLYSTFTHNLDVVSLKNVNKGNGDKTSESVLRELFLGEEPEGQQEESEETPQTADIEQQPNDEDNLQSLATESEPTETEREQEPQPSEGELLAQDEEAQSNEQTEPASEEPVQTDEQSLMDVGTEEEPKGEEEAASNVDTQKDNAGTSSNILKDGLSWTDSKADLSTEEGRAQMLEDAARKKEELLAKMKGQKPEKTDESQAQELAQEPEEQKPDRRAEWDDLNTKIANLEGKYLRARSDKSREEHLKKLKELRTQREKLHKELDDVEMPEDGILSALEGKVTQKDKSTKNEKQPRKKYEKDTKTREAKEKRNNYYRAAYGEEYPDSEPVGKSLKAEPQVTEQLPEPEQTTVSPAQKTDEDQFSELAKEPQAEKPIATKPEAPSDEQSLMDIPAPTPKPTTKPESKQEPKPEAKPAPVPEQPKLAQEPKPEQPKPAVAQKPPAEPASKPAATSPSTSTTKDDEAQFDSLARQETGKMEEQQTDSKSKPVESAPAQAPLQVNYKGKKGLYEKALAEYQTRLKELGSTQADAPEEERGEIWKVKRLKARAKKNGNTKAVRNHQTKLDELLQERKDVLESIERCNDLVKKAEEADREPVKEGSEEDLAARKAYKYPFHNDLSRKIRGLINAMRKQRKARFTQAQEQGIDANKIERGKAEKDWVSFLDKNKRLLHAHSGASTEEVTNLVNNGGAMLIMVGDPISKNDLVDAYHAINSLDEILKNPFGSDEDIEEDRKTVVHGVYVLKTVFHVDPEIKLSNDTQADELQHVLDDVRKQFDAVSEAAFPGWNSAKLDRTEDVRSLLDLRQNNTFSDSRDVEYVESKGKGSSSAPSPETSFKELVDAEDNDDDYVDYHGEYENLESAIRDFANKKGESDDSTDKTFSEIAQRGNSSESQKLIAESRRRWGNDLDSWGSEGARFAPAKGTNMGKHPTMVEAAKRAHEELERQIASNDRLDVETRRLQLDILNHLKPSFYKSNSGSKKDNATGVKSINKLAAEFQACFGDITADSVREKADILEDRCRQFYDKAFRYAMLREEPDEGRDKAPTAANTHQEPRPAEFESTGGALTSMELTLANEYGEFVDKWLAENRPDQKEEKEQTGKRDRRSKKDKVVESNERTLDEDTRKEIDAAFSEYWKNKYGEDTMWFKQQKKEKNEKGETELVDEGVIEGAEHFSDLIKEQTLQNMRNFITNVLGQPVPKSDDELKEYLESDMAPDQEREEKEFREWLDGDNGTTIGKEKRAEIEQKVNSQRECFDEITRKFPEVFTNAAIYAETQRSTRHKNASNRSLEAYLQFPEFREPGASGKEIVRSGSVQKQEISVTPEAVFTKPWLFVYPENRAAAEEMAKDVIAQRKADKLSYAKSDEDMLFDICRGYDREQCTTDCPTLFI